MMILLISRIFSDASMLIPECAKSSCPAPDEYLKHFEMADDIYMVTLSSHLSGSYNSAMLAANMYMEDHPNKHIHVFDSLSASSGQTISRTQSK